MKSSAPKKRKDFTSGFTPLETVNFNGFLDLFKMGDFKKNKKNKNKFLTGFTLIETFVAVTILLLAMTGPMVLVTKGVTAAKSVKGQITAIYLAQEAVEYIRNTRDTNILTGNAWLDGLGNCVGGKCKIDSPAQTVAACDSDCPVLKYNNATKLYGYASGANSIFRREIQINKIVAGKEVKITVDLFWNEGPHNKQFTVTEHLLKWQE
ncbi:MAG: hypothetical protein KAV41_02825 [Candidatus Pacebacteria bacterium]|nr:hypothetical protein [Candidatus Paceibacterota bacterium]